MKSIFIKTILINNNEIFLSKENIKKVFDKREWKAIIFTEYVGNKLKMRSNIHIKYSGNIKLVPTDEVALRISSNVTIGYGRYQGTSVHGYAIIDNLQIDINGVPHPEATCLFRMFNKDELANRGLKYSSKESQATIKEKYEKGLFKIYYNLLNESITNLSEDIEGKYSAMCSYLSVKKILEEHGLNISYPNCFIKGYRYEYDALILKNKSNKYFYTEDEVLATVELKVSGCIYKKSEMEEEFKDYLMRQHGIRIAAKGNRKIYDSSKKLHIPHFYITCHESSTNTSRDGKNIRYYDTCKKVIDILGQEYIGIFCAIKVDNEQFIIPIDYDLDTMLKKVGM